MKAKLFSILILLALTLAACNGNATPTEQASSNTDETAVTLRLWTHQNDAFNAGYEALIAAYTAEHPNVTINLETFDYDTYIQTLQTALPAKTEADLLQMFGSWVCSYADGGSLAEVPATMTSLQAAQDAFFAPQIAGYTCDGKLYGLPQEYNIEYGAVLVNTALAKEAGLTDITNGWTTWDDFIADAKALTIMQDGVMTRAGYNFTGSDGLTASFYSLILQNGGTYLTGDGFTVNTPEGHAALALLKRFVDEGLVDPVLFNDTQNWVGDSYFEGTSAIGLVGPWVVPEYGADYGEVLDVTQYVHLPTVGADKSFVAASGWGLAVSANSPAAETAWDFVKFATMNAQNAVQFNITSGTLPALKANATGDAANSLTEAFPHFGPFLDILQYAKPEGAFPDRDLVWYDISYPRLMEFLQGNMSADETLETIEREVNETLQ
ncbi:MAG: extracellular solute-binding protein [Anaerolineales bacterium]|nr:extracellular solute-binding protein [Anaerolineales bacterium]